MLFTVLSGCLTLNCSWTAIWQVQAILRSSLKSLFAWVNAVTSASMQSLPKSELKLASLENTYFLALKVQEAYKPMLPFVDREYNHLRAPRYP